MITEESPLVLGSATSMLMAFLIGLSDTAFGLMSEPTRLR